MILKALVRISARGVGKELVQYNKGDNFEVSDDEGERLIKLKAATYEGESQEIDHNEDKDLYLSDVELKKLDKAKLVGYAASLGLVLEQSSKREELINQIIDFIEEQKDMGD